MIDIISRIADLQEHPKPNPILGTGRECYAFSDLEDKAFSLLRFEAQKLFERYQISTSEYDISTDAIGNLFVTFLGKDQSRAVMSGSHVDSVYQGGIYDGVAGVYSAFRFLESLLQSKQKPAYNYTVAVFRAEEASPKTGNTCLGSRVATGILTEQDVLKINYKLTDGKLVPFREFFSQKYGEERWNQLLAELNDPPIKKEKIVTYEELHIEQSAVLDINAADTGIVIDGIGGAIRETVHIPIASKFTPHIEIGKGEFLKFTVEFHGEEAHTGGTPPNLTFTREANGKLYRRDALMAAAVFVQALQASPFSSVTQFTQCSMPYEVGFTTVPKEQNINFLLPSEDMSHFCTYLEKIRGELVHDFGVAISFSFKTAEPGKYKVYKPKVWQALEIPLLVEELVRNKCREQMREIAGGVGKVRATVTDFCIDKSELRCNLDFRDVDSEAIRNIVETVHARIDRIAVQLMDPEKYEVSKVIQTISKKPYIPVSESEVQNKVKLAKALGFQAMQMPSLPGHDAASLGAIGIPITMTFVRHDGRSHTGYETMPVHSYEKAEKLSHAYLAEKLGVSL